MMPHSTSICSPITSTKRKYKLMESSKIIRSTITIRGRRPAENILCHLIGQCSWSTMLATSTEASRSNHGLNSMTNKISPRSRALGNPLEHIGSTRQLWPSKENKKQKESARPKKNVKGKSRLPKRKLKGSRGKKKLKKSG